MKKQTKLIDYCIVFFIYALIGWLYEVLWMWFVVPPKHFVNRGVLFGPFLPIYGFGMLILLILLKKLKEKKHPLKIGWIRIISCIVVTTFIYTTIIEYTTPKIYNVIEYLKNYGLLLVIINMIIILLSTILVKKSKNKKWKELDCTIVLVFLAIWLITTALEYISHFVMDKQFHIMLWDYTKDFLNINKRVNWDASRNFAIGGTFLLYTVQPLIDKFLKNTKIHTKIGICLVIGIPMIIDFIMNVVLK